MAFALLQSENKARGLPAGNIRAGVSNTDTLGTGLEKGMMIPFATDPQATWVYYDCTLSNYLDSGIVVHNRLPRVNNAADTLSSCDMSAPTIDKLKGLGVNLFSNDSFEDIVQRMAHARYYFHLYGQAVRIGLQVPIPGAVKLADGTKLIPHDENMQNAWNRIAGNWSGFPIYHAYWSLWYTTASAPKVKIAPVAPNLAAHIGDVGDDLPDGMQSPLSAPDNEAVQQTINIRGAISGGR